MGLSIVRRLAPALALGVTTFLPFNLSAEPLEYNRDIRPILIDTCFACHGSDSGSRKADLRLDLRDTAIEMMAIAPGKPDESSMLDRIFSESDDERMPPPESKKVLTAKQKETLKQWIAEGAEYQPHWSFIAPERPAVPQFANPKFPMRNPIDAFVAAKLKSKGLEPAPEADRRTLARRLSLDLTGLPPAPEVVEAFVNDQSTDAYEKFVDQLMASPAWGEHRGRYWLDAARYGDTNGIHIDNYREIWSFRDWVIEAFNSNKPFDQFTLEQVAGDLLPNRTLDQQVASGFNRCNITTSEGGAINEEYLVLYARDRTETTSQVWLGLTAGCAVCHDHKFDPLSQKEFYQMAAFFNNTTQPAMDGNVHNTPPIVPVPAAKEDRERLPAIPGEIAEVRKQIEGRKQSAKTEFEAWLSAATPDQLTAASAKLGLLIEAALNEGIGKTLDFLINGQARPVLSANDLTWVDGHVTPKAIKLDANATITIPDAGDFERDQPLTLSAWIKIDAENQTGAIVARMDEGNAYRGWDFYVQGNRVGMHLIHRWPDNAIKTIAIPEVKLKEWTHVLVTYDGSGKVGGIQVYYNGISQPTRPEAHEIKDTARTDVPFKFKERSNGGSVLSKAVSLQDLRVYGRVLSPGDIASVSKGERIAALASKPASERTEAEKAELYNGWLTTHDEPFKQLHAKEVALLQEEIEVKKRATIAHVMQEKPEPAMAFVLARGEYDKRKDQVEPGTPAVLPPMPEGAPKNRLGFAQWLLRPEHPLTARVTVNRFWQEVFGNGIVRTSGDFGITGELPVNQELLDWLAIEFRESGWDTKKFFKLLVTSSTYRQSAAVTPLKLERDPQNRLLSRGPRFRMDAEMVRDYALAASGILVRTIGGPSVKPYQPPGVWEAVAMPNSNTRNYKQDDGEKLYRRSMYTFWKRSAPPAAMEVFNAPSREVCTVRRERTNTPLQALVTLNDPQMIEAERHLAQTIALSKGDTDSRIQDIAGRVIARPLTAPELAIAKASFDELSSYYTANIEDAKKLIAVGESKADPSIAPDVLAAWTMLTNELMNLDEVLNK